MRSYEQELHRMIRNDLVNDSKDSHDSGDLFIVLGVGFEHQFTSKKRILIDGPAGTHT